MKVRTRSARLFYFILEDEDIVYSLWKHKVGKDPDLFVQIYKGKDSNRQLHYDQRIFMRSDLRFMSMYGTFSRGYANVLKEIHLFLLIMVSRK